MPILYESVRRARNMSESQFVEIAAELRPLLEGDIRTDQYARLLYANDASIYQMEPNAVVLPKNEQDVVAVLNLARKYGIPVFPRGGGTSLAGSTVNHGIVMDFSRYMNQILEVNPEEHRARVQPGLVINQLNRSLTKYGLQYPIDPSTSNRATIGGGIGANSCGSHSVIYGKTLDNVFSVDVVLSDGTTTNFHQTAGVGLQRKLAESSMEGGLYQAVRKIAIDHRDEVVRRFPKIMRRVSGYNLDEFLNEDSMNLAKVVVGSEGTLAIVTESLVNLVDVPTKKGLAVVHFDDLVDAMESVVPILGHAPSAIELIDRTIINRCRESLGFRHLLDFVEGDPGCLLLVEFYGQTNSELEGKLSNLEHDLGRQRMGFAVPWTIDPKEQRQIWSIREAGLGLLMSVKGDAKPLPFVEDTAVAPEKLPEFIRSFREIVGKHGTEAAYYGHASVGCLHMRPMVNIKRSEGLATMEKIAGEIADLVLKFGGSLSGEHGDGIVRGAFTQHMFGSELYQAFRELKGVFDPEGILNPGKIIDTPGFVENLRLSPSTRNWEPQTILDFSMEGGLAGAVEQCNGQGACRKLDGTMCPSYMVTREEEHSTRGRANLLRMVLSGKLPADELSGSRLHNALDLCVECKGCKVECPSGVDMAKLKAEVLSKYNEARGLSLRTRFFSELSRFSKLGSMAAPLSNWIGKVPLTRLVLRALLGIHPERPLPKFSRITFSNWYKKTNSRKPERKVKGEVVLFHDTYMEYYYPQVGKAAVKVLEAFGYKVLLVNQQKCCGRPLISKGVLDKAKVLAKENIDILLPYVRRGAVIVGTEPSCLLTFRDEYMDLLGDESAALLAKHTFMLDEFLAQVIAADPDAAQVFNQEPLDTLQLHGHCHQKALMGMKPTIEILERAGYKVELIDAGCCGMAGAFGFEDEHYDLSRAMGAYKLFPVLEADDSVSKRVAVTGMSCRQQIDHFTFKRPRHAVEYLAEAIAFDENQMRN